jgi:hypothetical protein
MNSIIKFIKPATRTYHYQLSENVVREKLAAIGKKPLKIMGDKDFSLSFVNDHRFVMILVPEGGYSYPKNTSMLVGDLEVKEDGLVVITLKIKSAPSVYLISAFGMLLGLLCIINEIKNGEWWNSICCLGVAIGVPLFMIWLMKSSGAALIERYRLYVDKVLRA